MIQKTALCMPLIQSLHEVICNAPGWLAFTPSEFASTCVGLVLDEGIISGRRLHTDVYD